MTKENNLINICQGGKKSARVEKSDGCGASLAI